MIWLAWRQFRFQAVVALGAFAVLGVGMAITGLHLRDLYDTSGIAACRAHGDCAAAKSLFLSHDKVLRELLGPILLAVPLLIGVFWGAPLLARELESGSFRLAWTQSVTRTRWLAVKVAVVGLVGIALAELCSLMLAWWFTPVDRVNMNRFTLSVFDERGVVAIGYAAFAFALGVSAGALIRRTLPAMATTLAAFLGVRLVVTYWVRPQLIAPDHTSQPLSSASILGFGPGPSGVSFTASGTSIPNAWVYSGRMANQAGKAPTTQILRQLLQRYCPNVGAPPIAGGSRPVSQVSFQTCVTQLSTKLHLAVTYQPPSRFWTFQVYELAIFLGLALLLTGLCFWWVRHRLS
jgi:hypothetical protein